MLDIGVPILVATTQGKTACALTHGVAQSLAQISCWALVPERHGRSHESMLGRLFMLPEIIDVIHPRFMANAAAG